MPYRTVSGARKKVASLKNLTDKQVEVFISVFNDLESKGTKEESAYAQAIGAAKKVKKENRIIVSEDLSRIEKATFKDLKELLRKAIQEQFVFENGYLGWDIDFDPDNVYFSVEFSEYENDKHRYYEITYSVPYSLDGVTVSLGREPKKVEKETKYTEVKENSPFVEDGDVNRSMEWAEKIIEKVLKKFSRKEIVEKTKIEKEAKEIDGKFYIEKFKEEEQISYEPLYVPPEVGDYEGEGMTEEESIKMVKQIKDKIEKGEMKFNLFHKVESEAATWIDCFSNPWPSCFVGDQEVLKSQPVGVLKWNNKEAWGLRKQGVIKGPSIEGRAGNRRVVEDDE